MSRSAVFLDRDGTLNETIFRNGKPESPLVVSELSILPGVTEGLNALREAGFLLIVTTNQPNVPRGIQTRDEVELLHTALAVELGLDDFRVCWHDERDHCACRKPKPGLLLEAAADRGIDLTRSFMVGDRWRDVGAGLAAGCRTVLIDHEYDEPCDVIPDARVRTFTEAAHWILSIRD